MSKKKLVSLTTCSKPPPTEASPAFKFSKHWVACARKSPGAPAETPTAVMPSCTESYIVRRGHVAGRHAELPPKIDGAARPGGFDHLGVAPRRRYGFRIGKAIAHKLPLVFILHFRASWKNIKPRNPSGHRFRRRTAKFQGFQAKNDPRRSYCV